MKSLPYTLLLGAVPWNVFGTLTFRQEVRSEQAALTQGLVWLESVRVHMRLSVSEYYWFLRCERGEGGGRHHLHVLIRCPKWRLGWFFPGAGNLSAAHREWGRGMTRFRRVEGQSDPAMSYCCKDSNGADQYEIGKTAGATCSLPSNALVERALLQESAGVGERLQESSAGKYTGETSMMA